MSPARLVPSCVTFTYSLQVNRFIKTNRVPNITAHRYSSGNFLQLSVHYGTIDKSLIYLFLLTEKFSLYKKNPWSVNQCSVIYFICDQVAFISVARRLFVLSKIDRENLWCHVLRHGIEKRSLSFEIFDAIKYQ